MPDSGDPELDALTDIYARNREWAKRGSYTTRLSPGQEQEFQGWLYKNNVPYSMHWPPDQSMQNYDMRGFWLAMKKGDPIAQQNQSTLHFPDRWKTPYHESFSSESMYATKDAPSWQWGDWQGARLITRDGKVLAEDPTFLRQQ